MRGSLTLFKDFFEQPETAVKVRRKGRSQELNEQRNECLVSRYYYYGKFTEKRYMVILEDLSREFFLSPTTISEVVNDNITILAKLKREQPVKQFFTKRWPHLTW